MLGNKMLVFLCVYVIVVSDSFVEIKLLHSSREVCLMKTLIVNLGGTSLIIVEEHLGWGCCCNNYKNTLRKKC